MTMPDWIKQMGALPHHETTASGRFVAVGTFFCGGTDDEGRKDESHTVRVPPRAGRRDNALFLIHISISMLSAPHGDFDDADTVYADITKIDGRRPNVPLNWMGDLAAQTANYHGSGAWGHHFGEIGYSSTGYGIIPSWLTVGIDPKNMGISTAITEVSSSVTFRLCVTGDSWVGATYFVLEL